MTGFFFLLRDTFFFLFFLSEDELEEDEESESESDESESSSSSSSSSSSFAEEILRDFEDVEEDLLLSLAAAAAAAAAAAVSAGVFALDLAFTLSYIEKYTGSSVIPSLRSSCIRFQALFSSNDCSFDFSCCPDDVLSLFSRFLLLPSLSLLLLLSLEEVVVALLFGSLFFFFSISPDAVVLCLSLSLSSLSAVDFPWLSFSFSFINEVLPKEELSCEPGFLVLLSLFLPAEESTEGFLLESIFFASGCLLLSLS